MKQFDFHIHSTCSNHKIWGIDGISTPQEIVEVAVKLGLDGIAITDHNTLRGSQKAIQYVKERKLPILIIPGAEIRSLAGDIIALGISEDIKKGLSVSETLDAIKSQNGTAIAAHPYKYNTFIYKSLNDSKISSRFDALEIFNAGVTIGRNHKAELLANRLNKPGISVSDAHYKSSIGYALTFLKIENPTVETVLKAIKQGKIQIQRKYPPLSHAFILYSKKFINLLKRTVGRSNKSCYKS
ncbi:MAG: CehA/McbA family metallohydrolase [Candidatus Helarchaeota archaeon]